MIQSELQHYLTQVTDPDEQQLFGRAVALLEQLNYPDYMDAFENAVGDHTAQGDTAVLDALRSTLHEMITNVLKMHGVSMTDEATLSQHTDVVDALVRILNCDDKNTLMLALEGTESEEEIFAQLVSLVLNVHTDNLLAVIDEVSSALIERLREFIVEPAAGQLPDGEAVAKRQVDYAKYKLVFANDHHWCDRFVSHSEAVNLPFDAYASLYMNTRLKDDLVADELMAHRAVSISLIGMACLSSEGALALLDSALPYLERICPEMSTLNRLQIKLQQLLLEFNRAQT